MNTSSVFATFRRILYGLLILNVLAGAFLFYVYLSDFRMLEIVIIAVSTAISVFYVWVLIVLVKTVDGLEDYVATLRNRLVRLEKAVNPTGEPSHSTDVPAESQRSLSRRLGRL